ncbi:MAG: hypothetical protein AAGF67_11150, partial [Verrucomicrobiota bacterium]
AALVFFIGFPISGESQNQKKNNPQKPKAKAPAAAPVEMKRNQVTRLYHIPPTFIIPREEQGSVAADPFSDAALEAGSGEAYSLRITFLKAGIELNTDDSVSYDREEKILTATTSIQAHRQLENYFSVLEENAEKQIHVLVEYIEVNHLDFSDWLLENRLSGDGTPLREEVQKWARAGEASILESVIVTARSGQRAKVESISEHIYPTEYDPPEIPNELTQAKDSDTPVTGVTPTAFETRNVGVTVEVDPVIGADDTTIDLNLAPEIVKLEGHTTWANDEHHEESQVRLPTFYTMKTTTQVTLLDGEYAFLSTLRPLEPAEKGRDALVLLFVRADLGSMGRWSVEDAE